MSPQALETGDLQNQHSRLSETEYLFLLLHPRSSEQYGCILGYCHCQVNVEDVIVVLQSYSKYQPLSVR